MSIDQIGIQIESQKEVVSTHTLMMDKAEARIQPPHGYVLAAQHQSGGKGLADNLWESEEGKNLLASVFLTPDQLLADKQFYLNMAFSLSVYYTIKHFLPDKKVCIKWPNDIYVDDFKIAGILISHTVTGQYIGYSVVSTGININQKEFASDAPNPIALIHYLHDEIPVNAVLQVLIKEMNRYYQMFIKEKFIELHRQYTSHLYGLKQWRDYSYRNEIIKARIVKVLAFGQLELETELGQLIRCEFKEISFII